MWDTVLGYLQQLDLWSLGIGIIVIVSAFFVWSRWKGKKNKEQK